MLSSSLRGDSVTAATLGSGTGSGRSAKPPTVSQGGTNSSNYGSAQASAASSRESLLGRQLYLGNLPPGVGWQDIKDLMRVAGHVVRVNIMASTLTASAPPSEDSPSLPSPSLSSIVQEQGRIKKGDGYAIVLFGTAKDARKAIETFNGYMWQGFQLEVREDKSLYNIIRPQIDVNSDEVEEVDDPTRRQVIVTNIPFIVGWQDIKDLFREAGTVLRADIKTESKSGKSKGYGSVVYSNRKEAELSVKMFNGFEWFGRRIEVRRCSAEESAVLIPAPAEIGRKMRSQSLLSIDEKYAMLDTAFSELSVNQGMKSWAEKVRSSSVSSSSSQNKPQPEADHHGETPRMSMMLQAHVNDGNTSSPTDTEHTHSPLFDFNHDATHVKSEVRDRQASFHGQQLPRSPTLSPYRPTGQASGPRNIPQAAGSNGSKSFTSFSLPSSYWSTNAATGLQHHHVPSHQFGGYGPAKAAAINPFLSPPPSASFLLQPTWPSVTSSFTGDGDTRRRQNKAPGFGRPT